MNKNDKRYIKNHKLIKSEFINLLKEKDYNRITLKELCDRCLISKHTFYSHFENKDLLIAEIMNELFEGLTAFYGEGVTTEDKMMYMQNRTYDYISENFDIFYSLFLRDDIINFSRRLIYFLRKTILDGTNINIHSHTQEILVIDYMLHGDVSLLKNWVMNYDFISLEKIKKLAENVLKETHLKVTDITNEYR